MVNNRKWVWFSVFIDWTGGFHQKWVWFVFKIVYLSIHFSHFWLDVKLDYDSINTILLFSKKILYFFPLCNCILVFFFFFFRLKYTFGLYILGQFLFWSQFWFYYYSSKNFRQLTNKKVLRGKWRVRLADMTLALKYY